MNRTEAIEVVTSGKKIYHTHFSEYEYLEFKDGKLLTEDGYDFEKSFYEFDHFKDGWSVFEKFELAFCEDCFQMTNHLNGICQKHNNK